MTKKAKIWLFILLTPIVLIFLVSPPRYLTVEITANPQGIEEFYVVTRSSRANLHGRTTKTVDKRLVPINKKVVIPLSREKMLWFGKLGVNFYHPEYFGEVVGPTNDFVLPEIALTPIAWVDALNTPARWEIETPSYELRTEDYIADSIAHRIINMSHVHYHLWFINSEFMDIYLQKHNVNKMRKSVEILDLIVKEFDKGMLEESIATFGHNEFVQKHIDETHVYLNEIHEKMN